MFCALVLENRVVVRLHKISRGELLFRLELSQMCGLLCGKGDSSESVEIYETRRSGRRTKSVNGGVKKGLKIALNFD